MLTQIKNFVKKNEADIVLVSGVILIALISFGAGRLTVSQTNKEPIIIQDPSTNSGNIYEPTSSIQQSLDDTLSGVIRSDVSDDTQEGVNQGKFVGSLKSDKYHWPWCSSAKKIKTENQIWFESEIQAQAAGYKPGGNFYKLAPADYK